MRSLAPIFIIGLIAAAPLQAAITYSGAQNLVISNTFDGLYVDFTNPLDASAYTTSGTAPGTWDINPFFGGAAVGTSDTFEVVTDDGTSNSTLQNLSLSFVVDSGSTFVSGFSGSSDHMPSEFTSGSQGYIGFRIDDGFSGVFYGWMRVTFNDNGSPGTLHDWAWDTSGGQIAVGAIPEPNTFGMLIAGLGGLLLLRRRPRHG